MHRFSKAQQDALLPGVENRWVTLVAATTENPFFSVISPLLSRSLLLRLEPLTDDDIRAVLDRALADERGLAGAYAIDDGRPRPPGPAGRRRRTPRRSPTSRRRREPRPRGTAPTIDLETAETAVDQAAVRYDREGDQHYDVTSAFIKSLRGSDVDAALHYLARMIEAGEDPRFIARRLVILASEDIGLADPTALPTAVAAAQAVQLIGMPEARLNLAQATIALAIAPKSNAVITAIERRARPTSGPARSGRCPRTCAMRTTGARRSWATASRTPTATTRRTASPSSSTPRTWSLDAEYYKPTSLGAEAAVKERWERVRRIIRRVRGDRTRDRVGSHGVGAPDRDRRAGRPGWSCWPCACAGSTPRLPACSRRVTRKGRRRALSTTISRHSTRSQPAPEYVITHVGEPEPEPEPVPTVPAPVSPTWCSSETVVQAASLFHGLRRALSPETRNRIRFHMRQEVKRSRKQRRAELREARREWAARQRAAMAADDVAEGTAA